MTSDPSARPGAPAAVAPPAQPPFSRLLLTGAAGALGAMLRPRLKPWCQVLRVSDIAPLAAAAAGEEVVQADLADKAAMVSLLQGVQAVVHLGGVSTEHAFETILPANIVGAYHVYEAARLALTRRIVFASSNHVIGFYKQSETITQQAAPRPDTYYGLSKAFGENLAQFYFDRYGVETVSLRIGSCFPAPRSRRALSTWLSYDDLERLVLASLCAPVVGHTVIYGMSANRSVWWDNASASHIGYAPQDSSEPWRVEIEAREWEIDRRDPVALHQGGIFVTQGPF